MGPFKRHSNLYLTCCLLATFISIFLISKFSGFRTGIPANMAEATFFSPLHLTRTLISPNPQSVEILKTMKTKREAIWKKPVLSLFLVFHTFLIIFFLSLIRSAPINPNPTII